MRKTRVVFLALLILALSSTDCGTVKGAAKPSWQESAKKTVVASTKLYDVGMTFAGSLGLSDAKWAKVVEAANIYRTAASVALDAADAGDQIKYDVEVAKMNDAIEKFSAVAHGRQ